MKYNWNILKQKVFQCNPIFAWNWISECFLSLMDFCLLGRKSIHFFFDSKVLFLENIPSINVIFFQLFIFFLCEIFFLSFSIESKLIIFHKGLLFDWVSESDENIKRDENVKKNMEIGLLCVDKSKLIWCFELRISVIEKKKKGWKSSIKSPVKLLKVTTKKNTMNRWHIS